MALRLLDITLARGTPPWSPQFTSSDTGSGSSTQNQAYDDSGSTKHFSWSGPLPDLVLAPLSRIVFLVGYTGGSNGAITISRTAVTMTSEAAASTVEAPTVPPIFIPIDPSILNQEPGEAG